jgi:hypothetical protein
MYDKPLAQRLNKLANDIEKLGAGTVPWELGKVANALIEQARKEAPDDPVLAQIDLLRPTPDERAVNALTAGAVTALLRQAADAVPKQPPPMPQVSQGRTIMGNMADRQF